MQHEDDAIGNNFYKSQMILSIASGKGETGKTILSASFAALARNKVMVDSVVDAANLYLLLHPEIKETYSF